MTLSVAFQASATLLAQLANPAARALVLSVIVALGPAAFRAKTTSVRLFTWTAMLYAAIAMPMLQRMLPPLPIPAPAFLQYAVLQRAGQPAPKEVGATEPLAAAAAAEPSIAPGEEIKPELVLSTAKAMVRKEAPAAHAPSHSFWSSIQWNAVAAGIYLVVALTLLARFFVGLGFAYRLVQRSSRIDEPRLTVRLASRASAAGLAFIPRAADSEFISVPLTIGALRSTILLPSDWREWDDAKLDAVLAHEVSHVARRDALTQRLSLLHRAIFWFSPLAWWLDRHLADLAEQASDEAALACGADRKNYARTLLGFCEALQTAPGRVWWQGVAMAKAGQAEQRVERILSWEGAVTLGMKKSLAAVVLTLAVPAVYLAASVHPATARPRDTELAQAQAPSPAPTAAPSATSEPAASPDPNTQPEPAIAPPASNGPIGGVVSGVPTPPPAPPAPAPGIGTTVVAPVAPVGPVAPVAPLAPVAPVAPFAWRGQSGTSTSSSGRGFSYHYGFDDEQRFVIVSGKTDSLTMSGSTEDARHVEKLRRNIPGDFIWFQRDEKSYVIRDQATIDRAKKLWAPQEELGKKQEELGKQQEALGKQQEELGAKMEKVRVNVPDMTAELEKLKAELKQLSSGATSEQVGHIQSEIGDLQSKIGGLQSQAGEQQGELGRQQAELAQEASRKMKQLLDDAIAKGLAQPEL